MSISFETLALAKHFATGLSLGSFSNTHIEGNTIVFNMSDGVTEVRYTVPTPKDGVSVSSVKINAQNHLIVTLSDGSRIDAGELTVDAIVDIKIEDNKLIYITNSGTEVEVGELPKGALEEQLKCTTEIGSIKSGKIYNVGTSFETILRDILIKQEPPAITVTLTPSDVLYDVVDDMVSSIGIKTVASKKTNDIKEIEIFVNNVSVKKITSGVTSGGIFNYTHDFDLPTNEDFTIKVVCKDVENLSTTKSITVKFVGKTYYGYIDSTIGEPTESQIKALQNNVLKDVKGMKYSNITFDYNKVVYAYPKSFGELESIKDEVNNFTYYPGSFTKLNCVIDGIDYLVYVQNSPTQAIDVELTFK